MNRLKSTRFLRPILGLIIVLSLLLPIGSQRIEAKGPVTEYHPYVFPINPTTDAWKALATHDDMIAVSQIPADLLKGMSTESLIETILNYPLYGDFLSFNSLQAGFNQMSMNFNGFKSLFSRGDAGKYLLEKYRSMDPAITSRKTDLLAQGDADRRITYLEMLIAQDEILSTLTPVESQDMLNTALAIFASKQGNLELHGNFGRERTALLMGRMLQKQPSPQLAKDIVANQEFADFLSTGTVANDEIIKTILESAEGKASIYNQAPQVNGDSYTYTPNGTIVYIYDRTVSWDLTAAQRASADTFVKTTYPQASLMTSATRKYNCHSYAWYWQSASNGYWMESPEEDKYWQDWSYTEIQYPLSIAVGSKVSYFASDHSGVIYSTNGILSSTKLRSKWGTNGQVIHNYNYSPYNSSWMVFFRKSW